MLDPKIFSEICSIWGKPDIDLFASRLNSQLDRFISWHPDPDAEAVNAFSIEWSSEFYYLFPPFSLIARCVQKINRDQSECLMILPLWPTQIWYSVILELLIDNPVILPRKRKLLSLPAVDKVHPLINQMTLIACRISGNRTKTEDFQKKLQASSWLLGDKVRKNSMLPIFEDGYVSVVRGKLVRFNRL